MIPVYKSKHYLGSAVEFLKDPVAFTHKQEPILGDFFLVKVPFRKIYVTTNPEVIRHVLQTNHRNYKKSPAYKQLKLALGNGLVTSEGDFWFRQRRLAQPAFYKAALAEIFDSMAQTAVKFCQQLKTDSVSQFDLSQAMMKVTSDIVLKSLFSVENAADSAKMYAQIMDTQHYIIDRTSQPWMIPFYYLNGRHSKFLKDKRDFDTMAFGFIEEHRRQDNPPNDFLTMLLAAKDADTGETMSDLQVRDEAITIFAAGHETSANALTWTLYLLSKHPEIMEKLRQEIHAVIGNNVPTLQDLSLLNYTRRVIEEGMRLYPPAYALGREAIADDEILGEKIPKGGIVFISIFAAHRSARNWEDPDRFDPDRFLPEAVKEQPKFAYMPFGAGPRMCIGNHFAMMEMQLLLAMLVRDFDWEYNGSGDPEYQTLVTLKPRNGMPFKISSYSEASV